MGAIGFGIGERAELWTATGMASPILGECDGVPVRRVTEVTVNRFHIRFDEPPVRAAQ
ncbi:hypothetical protein Poly51_63630 [Rubripirellula tenax]|uniref:Uncharacterized protein n=1 Tax=Rubripirellula tenax TaxID=2528015 RepID=A0A5C6DYJ6_9BACT|nr:hypothetical protein Poly51_63630 [Rubripirellula tenax]